MIVILAATNLSTIGAFYYHRMTEIRNAGAQPTAGNNIPGDQRTRFFRGELNLDTDQLDQFREINRTFNRTAREIEMKMAQLREELIDELGRQNSDSIRLNQLAAEIGENHKKLKEVTITFYLSMKKICTADQQAKLHLIFQSMLNKDSQVNLPQPGNQWGRRRHK